MLATEYKQPDTAMVIVRSCAVLRKICLAVQLYFVVKQSNDLEIYSRSLTVVSPESCRVVMYVQESCAIVKMTAQCALYMGALKIFGTP